MNKTKLNNHNGRFTSLSFRNGNKTECYCAKILKVTDQTVKFRDVNSGEIILKKISSFIE
jgi:hypothetical protein